MKKNKLIIVKSLIFLFLFTLLIASIFKRVNVKQLPINSYYSEKKEDEKDINIGYVKFFLENLKKEQYQKAYDMLSEDCKLEIYNNDFSNFKNQILTEYFNKQRPDKTTSYYFLSQDKIANTNIMGIKASIVIKDISEYSKMPIDENSLKYYSNHDIIFRVLESSPYDFKLYAFIDKKEQ